MEEIIEQSEIVSQRHSLANAFIGIISALFSFGLSAFSFYLSFIGNYWFIFLAIYFILEGFFLIVPIFKKDEFKAMRFQGIVQIFSVILMMSYLLLMVLWNDPNTTMDYSFYTYLAFGGVALIKVIIALVSRLIIKNNYAPLIHAFSNSGFITSFFAIILIELTIFNKYYPGTSVALFDNLLKEKPLWVYIICIATNATLTIIAALLALSTDIKAKTKEDLSTVGKIKHTVKWFNDNEVSMFFSFIFTTYLAILALIHMKQSIFYIFLFAYYVGTMFIRLINYLWHKKIQKSCGDNIIRENRLSSWILLFDAGAYLLFSNVLAIGAIFMMIEKANTGTNIYLFLFMIVPMAIIRFITSNKSIRHNRRDNNTYRLGVSLIGLISVFFTILEVVAITMHAFPIVWLRYVFIVLAIIVAKIAVIVVAIIFIIHWIRSMILNRRKKERQFQKEKEGL